MTALPTLAPCILLGFALSQAVADKPHYTLTGKVVAIADGDTLTVLDSSNVQHKIRLHGIDAPERKQAFGTKAGEALASKVFGKNVRVVIVDIDRYKREVGKVYVDQEYVNLSMVRDGYAWRVTRYDKAAEFAAAENEARTAKQGLWADPNPIPPWEFRRQKRAATR
jgi:endonuclease YncB( thermonuclease family)